MMTSFSTSDTSLLGTSLRTNTSSLELWPPVDFFFASTTWLNSPLPRCSIILKSSRQKPLSSLGWPVQFLPKRCHQTAHCVATSWSASFSKMSPLHMSFPRCRVPVASLLVSEPHIEGLSVLVLSSYSFPGFCFPLCSCCFPVKDSLISALCMAAGTSK